MFLKILVPLDGSPVAEMALDYAKDLAFKDAATIHLVRASSPELLVGALGGHPVPQALIDAQRQLHHDYLVSKQAELGAYLVQLHRPLGEAGAAILEVAEREGCDLIVMTSHGRTGLSRFVMGSVAERVARHAPCPVFIVGQESLRAKGEVL